MMEEYCLISAMVQSKSIEKLRILCFKDEFVVASPWRSHEQYLCTSVPEILAKLNK